MSSDDLHVVRRLSDMPRGVDEVLAHLFLGGPQTLADLRAAMIADRLAAQKGQPPDEYSTPVARMVDHSLLYDVGQLAVANIVEAGPGGFIEVPPYCAEAVRVFLRAAFPLGGHGHVSRALGRRVSVSVSTRNAP